MGAEGKCLTSQLAVGALFLFLLLVGAGVEVGLLERSEVLPPMPPVAAVVAAVGSLEGACSPLPFAPQYDHRLS